MLHSQPLPAPSAPPPLLLLLVRCPRSQASGTRFGGGSQEGSSCFSLDRYSGARRRAELLPRETLGHQIGRRALIAKENDARVASQVKALLHFLPPMPSENPPRRVQPPPVQARAL
ncbi:unnamed protein product [Strongylus vulgaris]|uniref:Uncharacterized protein n=1 Tax=Strongylus vulgaris TaxID=40348 RepID=A0A3P7JPX3_STRVU|nr:unnamed protein product [Strongylus vulgaris]